MNELPVRKDIRLKGFDYSGSGFYFITICVKGRQELLGKVVVGAHPNVPIVELTETGKMVEQHISRIPSFYENVTIEKYIVMPNHIHMIVVIQHGTPGCASPTKSVIARVVSAFKSLSSRQYGKSLWQRSFHDHVIRGDADYLHIWQYIDDNPARWTEDEYYVR